MKEGLLAGFGLLLTGKVSHVTAFYWLKDGLCQASVYWNDQCDRADRPCGHRNPLLITKHSRRHAVAVDEIFALANDTW